MLWKFRKRFFSTEDIHEELLPHPREIPEEQKKWYEDTYEKIARVLNPAPHSDDKQDVRYSLNVDSIFEAQERIEKWMSSHYVTTFQQDLMDRITERKMKPVEFYTAALMDRKLFSAMKKNLQYSPKKETAVACCLALRLDDQETDHLLSKAGYRLTDSKRWDIIVKYCIRHGIYDLDTVNNLLYHFGEKTIGV